MVHEFLTSMGFDNAAKSLRTESKLSKNDLQVTSNVDLRALFAEYQKEQGDGSEADTESSDSDDSEAKGGGRRRRR